jgi:hypothetical protein
MFLLPSRHPCSSFRDIVKLDYYHTLEKRKPNPRTCNKRVYIARSTSQEREKEGEGTVVSSETPKKPKTHKS